MAKRSPKFYCRKIWLLFYDGSPQDVGPYAQIKYKTGSNQTSKTALFQDLKSCVLTDVRVQVPPRVLFLYQCETLFLRPVLLRSYNRCCWIAG